MSRDLQPDVPAAGRDPARRPCRALRGPCSSRDKFGKTLPQWRVLSQAAFLDYFNTSGATNGAEASDSLIELNRRVARGVRNRPNG